jgi:hypothetical protein
VFDSSSTQDDNFIVRSGTFSITDDTFTSLSASNNLTGSAVEIPHSSSWDNLTAVSWNMWVKMTLPSTPTPLPFVRQTLIRSKGDQELNISYWKNEFFSARVKSSAEGGGGRNTQVAAVLNDNEWHMATVVYSEDMAWVYIDNIMLESSSYSSVGTWDTQQEDLDIGMGWAKLSGKWSYYYLLNGYVDEFSMWRKALTEDDIDTLWNDGSGSIIFPNAEEDLLIYYTFPSRSDTIVLDDRGDNDGFITGSFLNYPSSSYYTSNSLFTSSEISGTWIEPLQTDWYISGTLFPIKGAITADTVDTYFGGAIFGDDIFPVGTEKIEYRGLVTSNNETYYLFISKSSHPYY